mmetsp:Transcript_126670/g.352956  ORF Transcript_126670/g.352956 Transcript_126670/m.352956 type:complete len:204 (+) Transcript_126670:1193-1804(+)
MQLGAPSSGRRPRRCLTRRRAATSATSCASSRCSSRPASCRSPRWTSRLRWTRRRFRWEAPHQRRRLLHRRPRSLPAQRHGPPRRFQRLRRLLPRERSQRVQAGLSRPQGQPQQPSRGPTSVAQWSPPTARPSCCRSTGHGKPSTYTRKATCCASCGQSGTSAPTPSTHAIVSPKARGTACCWQPTWQTEGHLMGCGPSPRST